MQLPASDLLPDRLPRFVGNGRAEVDKELAEPILRSPWLKTIAQKIELLVRVSPPPVIILAIDDLRLLRMKLQPTFLHARGYRCCTSCASASVRQCTMASSAYRSNRTCGYLLLIHTS